jgi:hypothetical protein
MERRNDMGYKIGLSVICSAVALILGLFFNHVYNASCKSLEVAMAATMVNVQQTEQLLNMDKKLDKIITIVEKEK